MSKPKIGFIALFVALATGLGFISRRFLDKRKKRFAFHEWGC